MKRFFERFSGLKTAFKNYSSILEGFRKENCDGCVEYRRSKGEHVEPCDTVGLIACILIPNEYVKRKRLEV